MDKYGEKYGKSPWPSHGGLVKTGKISELNAGQATSSLQPQNDFEHFDAASSVNGLTVYHHRSQQQPATGKLT